MCPEAQNTADAVFLHGKVHGCEWQSYIIYFNSEANDGLGSWEIEIVDKDRVLEVYRAAEGNAEEFFGLLPDYFHGEWLYCDKGMDGYEDYCEVYPTADFIVGRDGSEHDEMMFLVNWAKS